MKINKTTIKIIVNSKLYNLDAILNASYSFIDKAYIFLKSDPKNKKNICVLLKPKKKTTNKKSQSLKDDFANELLHSAIRYQISKNNKKIREYIISNSMYSSFALPSNEFLAEEKLTFQDDPLGIAIPWEEKYKNKS